MEPRQFEKSAESRSEVQSSPPRPQERKRRFQIVKLEERIAPGGGGGPDSVLTVHRAHNATCHPHGCFG
jgi:hypothetical protein